MIRAEFLAKADDFQMIRDHRRPFRRIFEGRIAPARAARDGHEANADLVDFLRQPRRVMRTVVAQRRGEGFHIPEADLPRFPEAGGRIAFPAAARVRGVADPVARFVAQEAPDGCPGYRGSYRRRNKKLPASHNAR